MPTLDLDKVFEQKTEIAQTVGKRLAKVSLFILELLQLLSKQIEETKSIHI